MISRDTIINLKLPEEVVEVPEWGGKVLIRALTAGQYLSLVKRMQADTERAIYHWIVVSCLDENGNRLFTDDDVAIAERQPFSITERLIAAIMRLNPQKDEAAKN